MAAAETANTNKAPNTGLFSTIHGARTRTAAANKPVEPAHNSRLAGDDSGNGFAADTATVRPEARKECALYSE